MTDQATEIKLLVNVAKLYYEEGLTQEEIGLKLNLSRAKVQRMLNHAQQIGIVEIRVKDPFSRFYELEEAITQRFQLEKTIIVPYQEGIDIKKTVGTALANYLDSILSNIGTIAVSWGTNLYGTVTSMLSKPRPGVMVVQLHGGMLRTDIGIPTNVVAEKLARTMSSQLYLIPAPTIVETAEIKEVFIHEQSIFHALQIARGATYALASVGPVSENCTLVRAGYLTLKDVETLQKAGAVGDIGVRFINMNGQLCETDIDNRTIGITLDEYKKIPKKIVVGVGTYKAKPLLASLRGGLVNVLATDELTAREILSLSENLNAVQP